MYYNAEIAKSNLFGYVFPQPALYRQDPWERLFKH